MKFTNKETLIAKLVSIFFALLMLMCIFLPYSSATQEHTERLKKYSDYYSIEELDMNGKDLINISMTKYAKVYNEMSDEIFGDSSTGKLYVVLVALIAIFSVCTVVFAIFNKPIVVIIFDILTFFVFCIQNWDYKDRGVIPNDNYNWGAAYYIFIICAVFILICAIITIIFNKKFKNNSIIA